jgi:hypothetical protein
MTLPTNFLSLSVPEMMYVITNLERVDRGLPPIPGLSHALDSDAQAGLYAETDPDGEGSSWGSVYAPVPHYLTPFMSGCIRTARMDQISTAGTEVHAGDTETLFSVLTRVPH